MGDQNLNASRLSEYVVFALSENKPNSSGEPTISYESVFNAYADVDVKSGSQVAGYGIPLTESIITVLCWYCDKANSKQVILWDGDAYEVQHIQPSRKRKSMIVTAKYIGPQSLAE